MPFTPLPQNREDEIHITRLLNVEERHHKKLIKTLLSKSSPLTHPSPSLENISSFRKQLHHDHTSLLAYLARTQFLLRQNSAEVKRYLAQSEEVTEQCGWVRGETGELKVRLSRARRRLDVKKGWDVLAQDVLVDVRTKERRRTREELEKGMDGLRGEIEQLRREGEEIKMLWGLRREMFESVEREGERLRKVIRGVDEKEKDGEEGTVAEYEDEGDADGARREEEEKHNDGEEGDHLTSQVGTPLPGTPAVIDGDDTGAEDVNIPDIVVDQAPQDVDMDQS